jgi:hypothetical protein
MERMNFKKEAIMMWLIPLILIALAIIAVMLGPHLMK